MRRDATSDFNAQFSQPPPPPPPPPPFPLLCPVLYSLLLLPTPFGAIPMTVICTEQSQNLIRSVI